MNTRLKHTMREKGQTTAEFVLVVPFLLFLFFLMVDFSWMLKNWIVVTNTSREAARCIIADSCQIAGAPANAPDLIYDRLEAGLISNIDLDNDGQIDASDVALTIEYIDFNDNDATDAGDAVVVCLKATNEWISPVVPFFEMVTLGAGDGILEDGGLGIGTREIMLIERDPSPGHFTADPRRGPTDTGGCDLSS
jgi:hypothetical protein